MRNCEAARWETIPDGSKPHKSLRYILLSLSTNKDKLVSERDNIEGKEGEENTLVEVGLYKS